MRDDQDIDKIAADMRECFRTAGQEHVFTFWDHLENPARRRLLEQLREIDLDVLAEPTNLEPARAGEDKGELLPAPALRLGKEPEEGSRREGRNRGQELLGSGKIALLLVAGGRGSRLGQDGPKGCFPLAPLSAKSLFEIHAAKIRRLALVHDVSIPWYIMTGPLNHDETVAFFQKHHVELGHIRMDRHVIFGEIAVHQMAVTRVEFERFCQGYPDGPGYTADALRPRGLGVEDTAKPERAQHPVHAGFAGVMVDAHLCEKRSEAGCGEIVFDVAGFVMSLAHQFLSVEDGSQRLALTGLAVVKIEILLCHTGPVGDFFAQCLARDVYRRTARRGAPAAAGTRPPRMSTEECSWRLCPSPPM